MQKRSLKDILQAGDGPVYGTCCISTSPEFPPKVKSAGVDFVFIDTEHVAMPRDKLSWMCRAYDALGITPIVRVPEPEPYRVCEYLDGGAVGIVAPYVETVDQVASLVGAVKLLPLKGERMRQCTELLKQSTNPGSDTEVSDDLYAAVERVVGGETASYLRDKNARNMLLINIESLPAMERLEALLAVPGVDGVFIGPHDLSVQLGVPCQWQSPVLHDAIVDIIRRTRAAGRSIGCHYSFDNAVQYQKKWVEAGADIVIHSADVKLFINALINDIAAIKSTDSEVVEPERKLAKRKEDFTV